MHERMSTGCGLNHDGTGYIVKGLSIELIVIVSIDSFKSMERKDNFFSFFSFFIYFHVQWKTWRLEKESTSGVR